MGVLYAEVYRGARGILRGNWLGRDCGMCNPGVHSSLLAPPCLGFPPIVVANEGGGWVLKFVIVMGMSISMPEIFVVCVENPTEIQAWKLTCQEKLNKINGLCNPDVWHSVCIYMGVPKAL